MSEYLDISKSLLEKRGYDNQPNYGYNESLFKNLDTQQPIVDKYGEPHGTDDTEI